MEVDVSEQHKARQLQPELSFDAWVESLVQSPSPKPLLTETGIVTEVADGVAIVSGLARALADEMLIFASGVQGVVLDLEPVAFRRYFVGTIGAYSAW